MAEEHPFITSLRHLLEENGMTQEELFLGAWQVDREGYAPDTLKKMFHGSRRPALRAMQAMLDSVGATPEQFPEFQAEVVHLYSGAADRTPQSWRSETDQSVEHH